MKSHMLSRNFLQDYERLRLYISHGISASPEQTPSLDNARNLLNHLYSMSYANEKAIHELSSHLERVITQNLFTLRELRAPHEEIGVMIVNMQSYLYLIIEMSNKETQKLIEEYKRIYS
jgi:hypothetical protein